MYQFSRSMYRELAADVAGSDQVDVCQNRQHVLRSCEAAMERLATDRYYFARPARSLFNDIRVYFPIKSLNFWVAAAASLIPLTLGLDAMRQLVFPTGPTLGFLTVQVEILILLILCVVFLIGAYLLLAYMEWLAVREGRLTEVRR